MMLFTVVGGTPVNIVVFAQTLCKAWAKCQNCGSCVYYKPRPITIVYTVYSIITNTWELSLPTMFPLGLLIIF